MNIVILGWGSLIRCPKNLLISGEWNSNGPLFPVEFARISEDGRLTLVLLPDANPIPVLWARMSTKKLNEAIKNLKEREATTEQNIGFINLKSGEYRSRIIDTGEIKTWASGMGIHAVIWTDLPSKFGLNTLNEANIISYLTNLKDEKRVLAEKYIRNTPAQIRTPFRSVIERELGWVAKS